MVMQKQMRVMLRTLNRLVHEKTAATAAAASRSAAGEPFWEHRPTWNARGVLADGEAVWAPLSPLAPMLRDSAKTFQPRAELGSGGVAPEQEALGKQFFFAGRRACRRNRGAENGTKAELCARHAERAGASAGRCITSVDVLRLIKREGSALA